MLHRCTLVALKKVRQARRLARKITLHLHSFYHFIFLVLAMSWAVVVNVFVRSQAKRGFLLVVAYVGSSFVNLFTLFVFLFDWLSIIKNDRNRITFYSNSNLAHLRRECLRMTTRSGCLPVGDGMAAEGGNKLMQGG